MIPVLYVFMLILLSVGVLMLMFLRSATSTPKRVCFAITANICFVFAVGLSLIIALMLCLQVFS